MKPLRPLPAALIAFGSAFLCGGLAALLTRGSMDVYSTLRQPPLAPPAILFPIAWSALYALMGVSLYRVLRRGGPSAETAALVYALQLVFNFAWSLLFFNARLFLLSFLWLLCLLALIVRMIAAFRRVDPPAGYLQIPYVVWVAFAGYLNCAIWLLNR